MRAWLWRVSMRMAEPRVATTLAIVIYSVSFVLAVALLVHGVAAGDGWLLVPPVLLGLAVVVAVPAAWRGGYWGRAVEQTALILAAGGLVSGAVVEVWDLVLVGDPASYYVLASLAGVGVLALFRSHWLRLQARAWRAVSLRGPLFFS